MFFLTIFVLNIFFVTLPINIGETNLKFVSIFVSIFEYLSINRKIVSNSNSNSSSDFDFG